MIQMTEKRIPSSDGIHQLYCRIYTPETPVRGLVHVVHGMMEHISRYESFMRSMASKGFICYGFDNLGHGHTADTTGDLGYLGDWKYPVTDVQQFSKTMKAAYGNHLRCYLIGHSMGSFIARCAASPRIWNKAIFLGTGGPHPVAPFSLEMIRFKINREGERGYSSAIENLIFSSYNKHFRAENDMHAWVSTQVEVRSSFQTDPLCRFRFTLNGLYVLIKLYTLCNSRLWFHSVSDHLPMLLLSGSDDPVGNYGKGIKTVYRRLKANGKQVQIKLYAGYRHELLTDSCRDEVIEDILQFLQ